MLSQTWNRFFRPARLLLGAVLILAICVLLVSLGKPPSPHVAELPEAISLAISPGSRVAEQLEASRAAFQTATDWENRRTSLREGFLRGARLWPLPEKTPLNPIIHSKRIYPEYSVENIALETMPGFYCTGNLYRPLGYKGRHPAILCPHGHFPEGRFREEHQMLCAHLARMGAIVFSYSMVGWQDSTQTAHTDPFALALQTWNSIRVVDYLSSLKEVDAKRIGITGASGGGTQTLYLTLVDDRIAVSAPVVIIYNWSWFSPACNCETGMPVMRNPETNAVELAAVAAPRPQLIISCGLIKVGEPGLDPSHDFAESGFPFVQQVYRLVGNPGDVRNIHFADEGHDYGPSKREAAYAFLAKYLGLKLLAEDPNKIHLEEPNVLEVFNAMHLSPANALKGSAEVDRVFEALRRQQFD